MAKLRAWQYVEEGWTQDKAAIDRHGERTGPNSEDAIAWCAVGAILVAYPADDWHPRSDQSRVWWALEEAPEVGKEGAAHWNDEPGRTQQEVVNVLRQVEETLWPPE